MSNTRNIALNVLLKIEQDSAYSNIALNNAIREHRLSSIDASFVSALVYGVLERQITLDYILRQYSKIPIRKIEKKTKIILRLGILQLLFMDKVPESAAVNESVNLAKKHRLQKSSGFINGVLRSIVRAEEKYTLPDKSDKIRYYAIKYSVPQEIISLWLKSYGEINTEQLLKSLNGRSNICARVNTLKITRDKLIGELSKQKVSAEKVSFLKNGITLKNTGSIERLKAYKNGYFHIQDASSQLCVELLDPKQGQIMLDICSAPGGKSVTAAQLMGDSGQIFSCDMYAHKLSLVKENAERLGIASIKTVLRDGQKGDRPLPIADRILCDVPCSGLGLISRKPEIRYKDNLIDNDLPDLQYKILCKSAENLADGGRLVYSTCTLNPEENNKNTARFLRENPKFYGIKLELPKGIKRAYEENDYEITLMPHTADTDGFYIAVFGKKA